MTSATELLFPATAAGLPDMLWEQVRLAPDRTAVVCGADQLSYRELAEASAVLATYLGHLGVVGDVCVGIYAEPSMALMTGVWGILCAGGAYLPLSPEYPEERLRYMMEDARVNIVFCQSSLRSRLDGLVPTGTRIIIMEHALAHHIARGEKTATAAPVPAAPNNLAYVIYTSGSTGKPKGVMIEQRSIVSQMNWLRSTYQLDASRVVLQKTPISFDAAQWEILAPSVGSTVVVGAPGVYRDPDALLEIIIQHNVTTLQCVPTLLQALLDNDACQDCSSLAQVFSGGEILSRNLALQCLETLPHCELINLYGPTECTINASSFRVLSEHIAAGPNAVSIGMPVTDTAFHILDERGVPVGQGEVGELYIGGVQVARGYLHRPDLTSERFVDHALALPAGVGKLYRTGDLVTGNADGTVQFAGRADNQVKLRGFRVELDEIRLAIEQHAWVKNAAVLIKNDSRTGFQNLIACIELNAREAALMDQGSHGAHHQSKNSKLQVKAQLSNQGCRDAGDVAGRPVWALPCAQGTAEQHRLVFARKTYRFFEGGAVALDDLTRLLAPVPATAASSVDRLDYAALGELLRHFGQFLSSERLLPKYGYASPGALYATQLYVECGGIGELPHGYYYYHPVHHQLVLISAIAGPVSAKVQLHFIGKKSAIEPVYKNNILEVLEMETGHMLGLFDKVLPAYGLAIDGGAWTPAVKDQLDCAGEDFYLGSFALVPQANRGHADDVDVYLQAHDGKIAGLNAGLYRWQDGALSAVSDDVIQRKHVIAINQQVYERASFGVSLISRTSRPWMHFIALGRQLQHLQMNDCQLGFMSAGYSSKTGNDLPAATRMAAILSHHGIAPGPYYFALGGSVSAQQIASTGMKEDAIHMHGPAELIKQDLVNLLPTYMMPNKIIVLDALPQTANGKIDQNALRDADLSSSDAQAQPFVAPRTPTEQRIGGIWMQAMKWDAVSVHDDFFESGGNSLLAVLLVNRINREFNLALPMQVLFEASTIDQLALKVDQGGVVAASRLVMLSKGGQRKPIYCWPGLGGYPMNLRLLAQRINSDHPFVGVQAHGINAGETPFPDIASMARADIQAIKRTQPFGPYTLWGYSFGARVAYEVAHQLEQAGEVVDSLCLIAPGSPKLRAQDAAMHGNTPTYDNPAFVTILFSVFGRSISGPALKACLAVARDKPSFVAFVCSRYKNLDADMVARIVDIATQTYEFKYTFKELVERDVRAPLTIFKADGDDYSFIDERVGFMAMAPDMVELAADHYSLLGPAGIDELAGALEERLGVGAQAEHAAAAAGPGDTTLPVQQTLPVLEGGVQS